MAKGKGGFYAVKEGRKPGVYRTWAECEAQVKGFPGATFKRFSMHDEAAAFSGTGASSSASTSTECSNCSTPEQGHAGAGPSIPAELQKEKRKAEEKKLVRKKKSRPNSAGNDEPSVPSFYREPQLVFPSAPRSQDGAPRKTLTVYCDGSALGNGKKKARAGWGVFWGDEASGLSGLNEGRRLPGPVQTNNRAELMAIIRAIQMCPDPEAQLKIFTDSQYSISAINQWQHGWRRRGWILSNGGAVQNKDLIRRLERELRSRSVRPTLVYVKGHAGIYGNEMADRLANHGASLPPVPEAGWENLEPSESEDDLPRVGTSKIVLQSEAPTTISEDSGKEDKQQSKSESPSTPDTTEEDVPRVPGFATGIASIRAKEAAREAELARVAEKSENATQTEDALGSKTDTGPLKEAGGELIDTEIDEADLLSPDELARFETEEAEE